jgi:hypothetical protein
MTLVRTALRWTAAAIFYGVLIGATLYGVVAFMAWVILR